MTDEISWKQKFLWLDEDESFNLYQNNSGFYEY